MFFVAIRFSDEKIARLFDLARLILQPDFARPSHITLRGPYETKSNISDSIIGKDVGQIVVRKSGKFFIDSQNTVFLEIGISGVADFWYKPNTLPRVKQIRCDFRHHHAARTAAHQFRYMSENFRWGLVPHAIQHQFAQNAGRVV